MTDLFKATHCDRCGSKLIGARKMSWFNEDTICSSCIEDEKELRAKLPEGGSSHEGCGYIPEAPKY
jgi:hypothetical protein